MSKQQKFVVQVVTFGKVEYTQLAEFLWTVVNRYPLKGKEVMTETDLSKATSCGHEVIVGHWGKDEGMLSFWAGKPCPTCQAKQAKSTPADAVGTIKNKALKAFYEGR